MIIADNCKRELLLGFLRGELDVDDCLEFLEHVEDCTRCWGEVYNAEKSKHPHYYKKSSRQVKITERELKRIDTPVRKQNDSEVYQVA